jgi:tetratricopeptide (TPR) repeat protein
LIVLGRLEIRLQHEQQRVAGWCRQLLAQDLPGRALPAVRASQALGEEALSFTLGGVLAEALQSEGDPQLAGRLVDQIPLESLSLQEAAAWSYHTLLEAGEPNPSHRAWLLGNLGAHLSRLGRREDALAAAEEAVAQYRRLAAARPEAFLPDLAASLNNLGNQLSELGRREDALAAAEAAVSIRRRLAAARPEAFLPNLAMSLNNLGNRLSELGRREDALAAAEEAAEQYRRLAAARPEAFLPYLAASLNNLGKRLSELGRREDALAATEEAVSIRRRLAAARPEAFLPDLAASLGSHSLVLGNETAGAAVPVISEALEYFTLLARRIPAAFSNRFLMALRLTLWFRRAAGLDPLADPTVTAALEVASELGLELPKDE